MKKRIIFFAAFATIFFTGCGNNEKRPGEEYYDPEYRANRANEIARGENSGIATTGGSSSNNDVGAAGTSATAGAGAATPAETTTDATPEEATPAATPETTTTPVQAAQKPAAKSAALNPEDVEKGKNLIAKSDCLACHQLEQKVVGPAYVEIAEKYSPTEENIKLLAGKVIEGGAGNWGPIPMSPHPTLPEADAMDMVKYILSLKK